MEMASRFGDCSRSAIHPVLSFEGYDDFEDYLGPRWHCYLGDIIATIPVPLVFVKGQFESGVAARLLKEFAADPYPYLDEAGNTKMGAAHSDLLRKFTELAFDESAETRWQESHREKSDNINVGPRAETDLQNDLFGSARNFF